MRHTTRLVFECRSHLLCVRARKRSLNLLVNALRCGRGDQVLMLDLLPGVRRAFRGFLDDAPHRVHRKAGRISKAPHLVERDPFKAAAAAEG